MTNKHTRKALLSSALALILCFAMLAGTTFAWFTDNVTNGANTIKSGNLDMVLQYKTRDMADWADVDENTQLFNKDALYEPGYTEVVFLRVANAGNLAFKYQVNVEVLDEKTSTNVNGTEFSLKDYLEVGYYTQAEYNGEFNYADILLPVMFGTREDALKNVKDNIAQLSSKQSFAEGVVLAGEKTSQVAAIVLTMPTTVGNEANHKTGVDAPQINLGISVVATQAMSESDSFDAEYDKNAKLPVVVMNGVDLNSALNAGEDVILNTDATIKTEDGTGISAAAGADQTIDLGGNTLEKDGDNQAAVENMNGGNLTITNGTIDAGSATDYSNITGGNDSVTTYNDVNITSGGGGIGAVDGGKVVFNSGKVYVDTTSTSGRYNFYTQGAGSEITINGGEFGFSPTKNQKRAYIYASADTTVTINGGTFGVASTRDDYKAGIMGPGTVIIKGGTFGFDPTAWVAEGYVATESSGTWTVTAK